MSRMRSTQPNKACRDVSPKSGSWPHFRVDNSFFDGPRGGGAQRIRSSYELGRVVKLKGCVLGLLAFSRLIQMEPFGVLSNLEGHVSNSRKRVIGLVSGIGSVKMNVF
jgi:hypothetical protein